MNVHLTLSSTSKHFERIRRNRDVSQNAAMPSHSTVITLASDIVVLVAALSVIGFLLGSLLLQDAKYLPIPIKNPIRGIRSGPKESGDQV